MPSRVRAPCWGIMGDAEANDTTRDPDPETTLVERLEPDETEVEAVQTQKTEPRTSAGTVKSGSKMGSKMGSAMGSMGSMGSKMGAMSSFGGRISLQSSRSKFMDLDDGKIATRGHMIEYLTLQWWSRAGCLAMPLTTLMWVSLAWIIATAHMETSFRMREAVMTKLGNLTARPTRGVAPEFLVSQESGTGTTCSCACALDVNNLCNPPPSLEAVRFQGDVLPDQLHLLRARSAYTTKTLLEEEQESRQNDEPTVQSLYSQFSAQAETQYIEKTEVVLADVRSIPDVWFWIQHGLVPELWHEDGRDAALDVVNIFTLPPTGLVGATGTATNVASEIISAASTSGYLLPWTQVIGGLRMRQRRLITDSCRTDDRITGRYELTCHANQFSVKPFGPGKESFAEGFIPSGTDNTAFDVYLDVGRPEYRALETIEYMLKPHKWLDGDTNELILQAVLLNGEASPALFGLMELTFTFSLSGGIKQDLKVLSTVANPWAFDPVSSTVGLIHVFLLFLLYVKAMVALCQRWMSRRKARASGMPSSERLIGVWDAVEWMAIVYGAGVMVNHLILTADTQDLVDAAAGLPSVPALGESAEVVQNYHLLWGDLVDRVSKNVMWWDYSRLGLFGYTIVLTFQFFKIFRGQPKLAHMLKVLINASEDIIHFILVFLVIFLNFAFSGYMIYGLFLESWSTPARSINSAFRALMGSTDLMEMYKYAPVSTVLWFSLFAFSMIFVMMNLLLAMLFDHYEMVKDNEGSITGMFSQLKFLIQDLVDRNDGKFLRCLCCCCRRSAVPSHKRMLEALALQGEGMTAKEFRSTQQWVTGPKTSWKKHAHRVSTQAEKEEDFKRTQEDAIVDLRKLCDDEDYLESLKFGCLAYTARESTRQEAKLNLLRELVSIAESDIEAMRIRLAQCGQRSKKIMKRFSTRIETVEELVHTSLAEVVSIAEHAGVPTGAVPTKSPATRARLDSTMSSLRSLSGTNKSKALLTGSLKPVLEALGAEPGEPGHKKSEAAAHARLQTTVQSWHAADRFIDTHHKRAGPEGASRHAE